MNIEQNTRKSYLVPKNWIKSTQETHQFTCTICLEIVVKPVQCMGPCKALFCSVCAVSWKAHLQKDNCPQRCSSPFQFRPSDIPSVSFQCPFNAQSCQTIINGLAGFFLHLQQCTYAPPQIKHQIQYKKRYMCNSGHPLEFYTGSFDSITNHECANCGEKQLARYCCKRCDQFYCYECRKIQCSKNSCPKGHQFVFYPNAKQKVDFVCDICNEKTFLKRNGGIYQDSQCNFGFCQSCKQSLPEQIVQEARKVIINNFYNCFKDHSLITLKRPKKASCQFCLKDKLCFRYCQLCKDSFCYECKPPKIQKEQFCQLKHLFTTEELTQQVQQQVKKQFSKKRKIQPCQKCFQKYPSYIDEDCNIRLCMDCFKSTSQIFYMMQYRTLKNYTCDQGHPLQYYRNFSSLFRQCSRCQRTLETLIFCKICTTSKFYCCTCLSPINGCYLGHKLKEYNAVEESQHCYLCTQQKKGLFYKCDFECKYKVCKNCQQEGPPMNQSQFDYQIQPFYDMFQFWGPVQLEQQLEYVSSLQSGLSYSSSLSEEDQQSQIQGQERQQN